MFAEFFCAKDGTRKTAAFAWAGLVIVVAHSAFAAFQKARINAWYGNFYDLLQTSGQFAEPVDSDAASSELSSGPALILLPSGALAVRSALIDFLVIVLPSIVIHPTAKFIRSHWTLKWRLSMMTHYFAAWDPSKTPIEGASQRLHEDTARFAKGCDSCMVVILDSVSTLLVFVPVLLGLSDEVTPPWWLAWARSWWLVALSFGAAGLGVSISAFIGKALLFLEVNNQRVEARLRRSLVLLEAAPATECTTEATPDEELQSDPGAPTKLSTPSFESLWNAIRENYSLLYKNFLYLNLWLTSFDQLLIIVPYILVAPFLFYPDDQRVKMGVLVKLSDSFGKVFGSLSVIAENWVSINEFASAVIRLRQFEKNLFGSTKEEQDSSQLVPREIKRSDSRPTSPTFTDPPLTAKAAPLHIELTSHEQGSNGSGNGRHSPANGNAAEPSPSQSPLPSPVQAELHDGGPTDSSNNRV